MKCPACHERIDFGHNTIKLKTVDDSIVLIHEHCLKQIKAIKKMMDSLDRKEFDNILLSHVPKAERDHNKKMSKRKHCVVKDDL